MLPELAIIERIIHALLAVHIYLMKNLTLAYYILKKIKPANFLHNLKHNPCIDGKITIYENGNIGTCPLMRNNIIGNIRKDRICDILGDKKHCLYWDFTMENIVPCKECSSRYYCIDCRAIESTQTGNLYGKKYCPKKKILKPNNIAMLKKPNISDVNRQFKGVKIMIFAKR